MALWSLTSAFGVLLFAVAIRRLSPRDWEPAGSRPWLVSFPSARWSTREIAKGDALPSHAAPDEANLPRWLRPPAGREQTTAEQLASFAGREPRRFSAPPRKGIVRGTIAYRLVRLSDGPNHDLSVEIGRLDRGDEVEVIGDSEGYLKVRTASGLEGWVPRMVLLG